MLGPYCRKVNMALIFRETGTLPLDNGESAQTCRPRIIAAGSLHKCFIFEPEVKAHVPPHVDKITPLDTTAR